MTRTTRGDSWQPLFPPENKHKRWTFSDVAEQYFQAFNGSASQEIQRAVS